VKLPIKGAIDCDLHPTPPSVDALLPYLDEIWRDQLVNRHINQFPFQLTSYPPRSPLSGRPDWRNADGLPDGSLDAIRRNVLDHFGLRYAICNTLHGAIGLFNEDMALGLCRGVNDWVAKELLDREPRLRGSILVPTTNPQAAASEIERVAKDRRFVQVILLSMQEAMLGRRIYWPIYEAAEKHGLAICVHAGSLYRVAPTTTGWPSYHAEDYIVQSSNFEGQLVSLVAEGVFQKYPGLKVVFAESGFTWLAPTMWRTSKTWRGMRPETPWLDRPPSDIVREHMRFTLHPVDAPKDAPAVLKRTLEHLGSDDMLLFSTDYPHWQFDGDDVLPEGFSEAALHRLLIDNPLETYLRLRDETVQKRVSKNEETVS
jgi:predicted TIM-barrel fold metal-dependent hydrolase